MEIPRPKNGNWPLFQGIFAAAEVAPGIIDTRHGCISFCGPGDLSIVTAHLLCYLNFKKLLKHIIISVSIYKAYSATNRRHNSTIKEVLPDARINTGAGIVDIPKRLQ